MLHGTRTPHSRILCTCDAEPAVRALSQVPAPMGEPCPSDYTLGSEGWGAMSAGVSPHEHSGPERCGMGLPWRREGGRPGVRGEPFLAQNAQESENSKSKAPPFHIRSFGEIENGNAGWSGGTHGRVPGVGWWVRRTLPAYRMWAWTLCVSGGPLLRLPVFDIEPCPSPSPWHRSCTCTSVRFWRNDPVLRGFSDLVSNQGNPNLLEPAGPHCAFLLVVLALKTPPTRCLWVQPYQEWGSTPTMCA